MGYRKMRADRRSTSLGAVGRWISAAAILGGVAAAAPKPHIITFGKPLTVQWFAGIEENKPVALQVRARYWWTVAYRNTRSAPPHEITDRLFVVRRALSSE